MMWWGVGGVVVCWLCGEVGVGGGDGGGWVDGGWGGVVVVRLLGGGGWGSFEGAIGLIFSPTYAYMYFCLPNG